MTTDNEWWKAVQASCDAAGIETDWQIFPMATDSRYLRQANIPAFGISPLSGTTNLMHDHNEYVARDVFLAGITTMKQIVIDLASM